jgi:Uma2 family endonuclease
MDRASQLGPPSPRSDDDRDQVVVLRNVPWAQYAALRRARGERPMPRLAYLDGVLEIMTTGLRHELDKTLIARLVEAFGEETMPVLTGAGNTTFFDKAKEAGLEPDECYWIGKVTSEPDIALEIVKTSGGIDKLEIYRRLGVREVWFWITGRFWIYTRSKGGYAERSSSAVMPDLDFDRIARIVLTTEDGEQNAAVRAYRRSLRRRR